MALNVTNHLIDGLSWQQWHIRRPERLNAIGLTIAGELWEALNLFREKPPSQCRAIVITAESVTRDRRKIWIAGGDLKELSQLQNKESAREYANLMRTFCEGLEYLPCPVVSLIDGEAIGGGAELALAGDIRMATLGSSLEFKQLKVGLPTGYGAASRLIDLIGKARAQSLLYFSEKVSCEEALALGLVHRLVNSSDLADINSILLPILKLEPRALAAQKEMLRMATTNPRGDHSWSDEVFEQAWMNETHRLVLNDFLRRSR